MHETNHHWIHSAGERTIRVMLMTAESLASSNEPLDAEDTEQLHWCWEAIHYVTGIRLAHAQMEALKSATDTQPTTADLARMLADMKAMMESKMQPTEAEAATTR